MFTNKNLSAGICIPLRTLLPKTFFVLSFDFKSVYHHVDIFPDHRIYLAFSWEFAPGHTRFFPVYCFAFGLSSAPDVFTNLLKPLETHWRAQRIPNAISCFR